MDTSRAGKYPTGCIRMFPAFLISSSPTGSQYSYMAASGMDA